MNLTPWCLGRLSHLPKFTQPVNGEVQIQTPLQLLNHYAVLGQHCSFIFLKNQILLSIIVI